jgi:MYXO-CTERM domain-containing protein
MTTCFRCGDNVLDPTEACDDGDDNADLPDACRLDCTLPACGDAILDTGEECDDGDDANTLDADACRPDCTLPTCGDNIVDSGEECDNGDANGPDAPCRPDCTTPVSEADPDPGADAGFDTAPGEDTTVEADVPSLEDTVVEADVPSLDDTATQPDAPAPDTPSPEDTAGGSDTPTPEDTTPPRDATTPPAPDTVLPGDTTAGTDAGRADTGDVDLPTPDLTFGGGDGCECRQGAPAPTGSGWLALAVLGLLLRRRQAHPASAHTGA